VGDDEDNDAIIVLVNNSFTLGDVLMDYGADLSAAKDNARDMPMHIADTVALLQHYNNNVNALDKEISRKIKTLAYELQNYNVRQDQVPLLKVN
jgi:hypothetical protein